MFGIMLILPLVVVVASGAILRLSGIIEKKASYYLNNILYWGVLPVLLFRTTQKVDVGLFSDLNLLLAIHVPYLVAPGFAWLIALFFESNRKRVAFSVLNAIRSNNIFIGIPVVSLALGQKGLGALSIFFAIGLLGYNLISITWAQICLSGRFTLRSILLTFRQIFANPLIWACLLGVGSSVIGFESLPGWMDSGFEIIVESASGIALISLGISLEFDNLIKALWNTWRESLMRLFIYPALVWIAFIIWPVEPVLAKTIILVSAMPSAINNFVISQGMGMDTGYASESIAASTIISVLSIPLWLTVLGIS